LSPFLRTTTCVDRHYPSHANVRREAQLRRSAKLFADETTAPVLDPGRGRTKTGQLWAYPISASPTRFDNGPNSTTWSR